MRHPWVFSGGIAKTKNIDEQTVMVEVIANDGNKLGYGFWDADSQISVRLFEFGKAKSDFDPKFWKHRLHKAYSLRKSLLPPKTNMYRLVFSEGDGMPGLIVDVYHDLASVQLLAEFANEYLTALDEFLPEIGVKDYYLKNNQTAKNHGANPFDKWRFNAKGHEKVIALENGNSFEVDIENGQKTGFFIDQRDNRALLGELSKEKTVLNTFSFSGGFSIYALANQAQKVVSVDVSKPANQSCTINQNLNHEIITADCFDFLKKETEKFDLVILDPPAFAKNSKAVSQAARGYKELNMSGLNRVREGGFLFTFSCSQHIDKLLFQKIVFSAAADVRKNVRIVKWLSQPFDHPVNIYHPEGEYLKGLLLYVD
ncbi:MAG: class I SAM-dependent rRNA methyltransferase [Cytophagales bacterium]